MSQFQVRYEHFKREDTTNSMVINLYDDNGAPITPSGSHTWTAKVATDDGYAGEFPVTLSGNDIVLRSSQMTRLPHGQYVLEIWENNNGAVTIYPNAGFIPFEIHKNAPDAIGIVEPTKDINKIIDDLHKAGQNIKLGTVTTGASGSSVVIRQRLENGQNLLDFTIPRGADGATPQIGSNGNWVIAGHDTGKPSVGRQGDKGDPPTLRVGSVTKVAPGGTPTASVTGSNGDYSLNLGIPEGQQGAKGDGFTDYGNITKSGDLNDYKRTGVADIQAVMANKPAGYEWNWGVLKVFAPDNGSHHIVQEWYPSGISNGTMFFRYYTVSGRGGKWNAWQKIGEVSSAPIPGLLYTGSFTLSTGSTPTWAYKAIPVGDMDGDTLTVTLTPHQTAGAKLDQVCVALYDSTRTTALATYAYPATEQTSTITIVDKRPGKDAQLLFYANDKTINSNTTIEFSNVTIVGS